MTTDTAVMVSSEILELQKPLKSMDFIENPEVPIDGNVQTFLDKTFSIEKLGEPSLGAKGQFNDFVQSTSF